MRTFHFLIPLILFSPFLLAKETNMSEIQTKVKFSTTSGDFIVQLDTDKAPITTANFITYVTEEFYTGTIFHRIIPNFMVQGGGFDTEFNQKDVHDPIINEADNGLENNRGTLAMARTSDPDSATGQFFINYKDNDFLNHTNPTPSGWGYAVFGHVIEGMEIIDAMTEIPTGNSGMHQDVPETDIVIESAQMID